MKKSRFSEQQIAFILRQAEEGTSVAEGRCCRIWLKGEPALSPDRLMPRAA